MGTLHGACDVAGSDDTTEIAAWARLASDAAREAGTPCYLSRWLPVLQAVEAQERHFSSPAVRSWLSFKTHPVQPLARAWLSSGRGVEVVSEAEFVAVRDLGCPSSQLLVNGVAKHAWLTKYLMPDLRVHFDSLGEIEGLLPSALAQRWRVGLRCRVPSERDARDHGFGGQFGLSAQEIRHAAQRLAAAGLPIHGLHFHLGQASRLPGTYAESVDYIVELCLQLGLAPAYLDCGGGIDGARDIDSAFAEIADAFEDAARRLPTLRELWLENGRHLTRRSAVLVIRVLDRKQRDDCCYLICDGGRTNHALDADNGAHRLIAVPDRPGRPVLTTICGPTCMSDDRLARVMLSESVGPGDLMVWFDAGAYHLPWETRFSHGLSSVVWGDEHDHLWVARARESPAQWSSVWTAR